MMIVNVHIVLFFISLLGLKFSFFFLSFCFRTVNGCLWGKCVCACVRVVTCLTVCVRGMMQGVRCFVAPAAHRPLCPCSSSFQCVQVFPRLCVHSSKRRARERTGDGGCGRGRGECRGAFPLRKGGKKQPREHTFERKKKDIFLLCWVTMKSVNF